VARVRARRVAKPVSASRRGPPISAFAPFSQLGHRTRAHAKSELTAQTSQEPDWSDPTKWFDVL